MLGCVHHRRCRGHSFLKVNEELLDIYAACDTSQQVIAAQQAHLARMAAGQAQAAAHKSAPHSVLPSFFRRILHHGSVQPPTTLNRSCRLQHPFQRLASIMTVACSKFSPVQVQAHWQSLATTWRALTCHPQGQRRNSNTGRRTAAAHRPQRQPLSVRAAVLGQPMRQLAARRPCCRAAGNLVKATAGMAQPQIQQAVLQRWCQMLLQLQSASPDWVWTRRVVPEALMESILP